MPNRTENATADLGLMRELNTHIILNLIRQEGSISRAEIAKRTQLSRSTVSNIITALLEHGVVAEAGTGPSRVGRRPIMVNFNYQAGYVVGVDLGANHLLTLVTDLEGRVLAENERPVSVAAGPDVVLPALVSAIDEIVREAGVEMERVIGVGVGVPGPLDNRRGTLIMPPIMPGWHNFKFQACLEQRINKPIYIDNDANLGAIGERWRGAGQGYDHLAYIKIGTGIGCGLILDGQIYRGFAGSAGEIGHMSIEEDGPICTCGNYGCLESLAGGRAIARAALAASNRAQALVVPAAAQASDRRFAAATLPSAEPGVEQVVRAALAGDEVSIEVLQVTGRRIGVAIANLINLLNPGLVIIGGGVSLAGDLLLEPIRQTVARRVLPVAMQYTRIVQAQLGREAIGIGAATLVLQQSFKSPALNISTQL
jgi:glucokinase-like ROK family protein